MKDEVEGVVELLLLLVDLDGFEVAGIIEDRFNLKLKLKLTWMDLKLQELLKIDLI